MFSATIDPPNNEKLKSFHGKKTTYIVFRKTVMEYILMRALYVVTNAEYGAVSESRRCPAKNPQTIKSRL